jgi:hypothetical protein
MSANRTEMKSLFNDERGSWRKCKVLYGGSSLSLLWRLDEYKLGVDCGVGREGERRTDWKEDPPNEGGGWRGTRRGGGDTKRRDSEGDGAVLLEGTHTQTHVILCVDPQLPALPF